MSEVDERLARMRALDREIRAARAELLALLKEDGRGRVEDATFEGPDGPVHLSDLFGDKDELVMSFNMGASCPYCTCWGDAIQGFQAHLASVAAFVCVSPESPDVQRRFAAGRGWTFPMVSHGGSDFVVEMGFAEDRDGERHYGPGVATFRKTADGIERIAAEWYGPGDVYNGLFHMLELLDSGGEGFVPRHSY